MRRKIKFQENNQDKKKIVFLVSSMQGGGAERIASLLCNYWVSLDHEVILIPTFSGRGENEYPLDQKVKLEFLSDQIDTPSKFY